MRIKVQVFGELIEAFKDSDGGRIVLEFPEGADIKTLLERLGLAAGNLGVVLLNGKFSSGDALLHHDDQIQIIPQLEGG